MTIHVGSIRQSKKTEFIEETEPSPLLPENHTLDSNGLEGGGWDIEEALQRVDGDREFLREMVELFLAHSEELMHELREGLAANDAEAVRKTAHALKGSAAEVSAREIFQAARRVEETARNGDVSALGIYGQLLDEARLRLYPVLRAWLTS